MGPPYGSAVGRLGVGREVEDIRVPSRCKHDHIRGMTLYLTGYQVSRHNAACSSIDDHNVEQLPSDMHCHRSEEHTSELQSPDHLVCRLLLEKKKQIIFSFRQTIILDHPRLL